MTRRCTCAIRSQPLFVRVPNFMVPKRDPLTNEVSFPRALLLTPRLAPTMCVTESQVSQIRGGFRASREASAGSSTDPRLECVGQFATRPATSSPSTSRTFAVDLTSAELAWLLPLRVSENAATPSAPTHASLHLSSPTTPKDAPVEGPADGGAVRRLATKKTLETPIVGTPGGSGDDDASFEEYRHEKRGTNGEEDVTKGPLRGGLARDVVEGRASALFALATTLGTFPG